MAKGKNGTAGKKRQRLIQAASRRDMYVLAGLPQNVYRPVRDRLEIRLPLAEILGNPAPLNGGALYPERSVASLVRAVGQFAVARREQRQVERVAPATITLLYVPSTDDERLLRAFDFAVMPIPLVGPVAVDGYYRSLRYDADAVTKAVIAAVDRAGGLHTALNHVIRRLGYQSSDEGLLLPPHNFLISDGNLVSTFRAFRKGEREWTDRLTHLGPRHLTHDDIPKRIAAKKTEHVFVDYRNMAFLIAHPTAYDGAPREVAIDTDTKVIASKLRSLYRFGGALARGLHHDAQRSDGSPLGGATFHCEEKGTVKAQGDYANVYPNDFVRLP